MSGGERGGTCFGWCFGSHGLSTSKIFDRFSGFLVPVQNLTEKGRRMEMQNGAAPVEEVKKKPSSKIIGKGVVKEVPSGECLRRF